MASPTWELLSAAEVVLFGGNQGSATNDLHVLSLTTGQWDLKEPAGEGSPEERTYHSAVAVGTPQAPGMLVFGGFPSFPSFAKWGAFGGGDMAKNDLWRAELGPDATCTWEQLEAGGEAPSGRHGQTLVVEGDAAYVFAGYSGNAATNDLYKYSMGSQAWERLYPAGAPPPPRWRHVAWVHEGCMYVQGGNTREEEPVNLDDLFCYRIAENRWERARPPTPTAHLPAPSPDPAALGAAWGLTTTRRAQVECGGEAPCGRHDHTAVVHGNGVFVFGGNAGGRKAAKPLNDLYRLDLNERQWVRVAGTPPAAPRYAHAAVGTPEGMLVVGGDSLNGGKLGDVLLYRW